MGILTGILIIIVCCVVIWRASDDFENASVYLGRNLSDGVRGATINAIGSSMPELFTTIFFFVYFLYMKGDAAEANNGFAGGIGTTAGSAIFNGMIIPAVVILAVIGFGLAKQVTVSKKVILRDGLSLIVAEFILILLISGSKLYWWHGLILMLTYAAYVILTFSTMSKNVDDDEDDEEEYYENDSDKSAIYNLLTLNLSAVFVKDKINNSNGWLLLIMSMVIIGVACFFLVQGCEYTGLALGIDTYFVAVVLASAATSVPDTILSYRDALNGEYDDAVANALGSNIFDVCFALGLPLFVFALIQGGIEMSPETVDNVTELRVLLLGMTIVAFFIYYIGNSMGRIKAFLLLGMYIAFTIYILASAYKYDWAVQMGEFLRNLVG